MKSECFREASTARPRHRQIADVGYARVWLCAIVGFWATSLSARADDLDRELAAIDELRATAPADIDDIDRMGQELLGRYSDPKSQGRIYYQMALTAVQSGLGRAPEKIAEYCKKALELHDDPLDRGRVFCYFGDLFQVWNTHGSDVERRRLAAKMYLNGLKESLAIPVPDSRIELPVVK